MNLYIIVLVIIQIILEYLLKIYIYQLIGIEDDKKDSINNDIHNLGYTLRGWLHSNTKYTKYKKIIDIMSKYDGISLENLIQMVSINNI